MRRELNEGKLRGGDRVGAGCGVGMREKRVGSRKRVGSEKINVITVADNICQGSMIKF